jgi:hypothetical protein
MRAVLNFAFIACGKRGREDAVRRKSWPVPWNETTAAKWIKIL